MSSPAWGRLLLAGSRISPNNGPEFLLFPGQRMEQNSEKVLAEAVRLMRGDTSKAMKWYFEEPLPEFDRQTAAVVVAQGREADVLRLLEMYEAGFLG